MTKKFCNVFFICTGNLCRSPMAEGILKKILSEQNISTIHVKSAGMMISQGLPAADLAQAVAQAYGIDLSGHVSQFLSMELIQQADLIFVMEKIQQEEIGEHFPGSRDKLFLLRSFGKNGNDTDVDDPIGGNHELFELCFQLIESEIRRILPDLLEWCEKKNLS